MEMNQLGTPEIGANEIEKISVLGDGSFGTVFKGRCREEDVAVKVLHKQDLDDKTLQTFRQEVEIVSKIFHPNVVLFMGACTVPGHMMIVTELMPKGDLETMLQDQKIQLSLLTRIKMAKDAALGITWLHNSNPQLIHRDLKTSNLLVDQNNRVKVCDFGLSQLKRHGELLLDGADGAKGTPLWMAPEVMMGKQFDEKADVYSFGIVLWEIVTREEPFKEFDNFETFRNAVCFQHVRPKIPDNCSSSVRRLIECCWQENPVLRPSFREIVAALQHIIVETAIEDEIGRRIWKERFLNLEWVSWAQFLESFFDVLDYFGDTTFIPLPEQPTTEQIQLANELQLQEYETRSLQHKYIVQEEINRRKNIGAPMVDAADLKLRCLKVLLAETRKGDAHDKQEEIVTIERFGSILSWFGPFVDPETKRVALLDSIYEVLSQHWFHGDVSQVEAQNRLTKRAPGTFLIRFSSVQGCFTISKYCANGTIAHQRIIRQPNKGFIINNKCFHSLGELIYSSSHELELTLPCPGSRFVNEIFPNHVISGYIPT